MADLHEVFLFLRMLADLSMPGIGGKEAKAAARRLRTHGRRSHSRKWHRQIEMTARQFTALHPSGQAMCGPGSQVRRQYGHAGRALHDFTLQ